MRLLEENQAKCLSMSHLHPTANHWQSRSIKPNQGIFVFLLIPKAALPVSLLESDSQHLPLSSEIGYGGNLLIVSPGRRRTIPKTGCGSVSCRAAKYSI
jgi:hypothetical protein